MLPASASKKILEALSHHGRKMVGLQVRVADMYDTHFPLLCFFKLLQLLVKGIQAAAIEHPVKHQAYLRILLQHFVFINGQGLGQQAAAPER